MGQLRTAEIAGEVYCNLMSTFPLRFVDREGNVVGMLDALTPRESDGLRPTIKFEPVDDLYVAMAGLDWEQGVQYFRLVKRVSPTLRERLQLCQKINRITKIVVDSNVMEAVRAEGLPMKKLFLPRIYDSFQHMFYAHNVAQLVESDINNELMMKHPSVYSRVKKM